MNLSEATSIVEALANGIDPVSGQPLPEPGPYHQPRVIRALFTILEQVQRAREGEASNRQAAGSLAGAAGLGDRTGKPWTAEEDQQLIAEFHAAVEFRDMAKRHGRTRGAIVSRLTKLGEMQPRYVDPSPDFQPDFEVPKRNRAQAGKAWTSDHDAELLRHYDAGLPLEEIAERQGRGVEAVEVRLIKLGDFDVAAADVEFDS